MAGGRNEMISKVSPSPNHSVIFSDLSLSAHTAGAHQADHLLSPFD